MNGNSKSAGEPAVFSSAAETGSGSLGLSAASRAPRDGSITLAALIDAYMAQYSSRDPTRPQRLAWWADKLSQRPLWGPYRRSHC